ncbi:hypothetical protein CCR94_04825 [Rhodoblastus sphagnicola]|uniref:EamA domain-containing protein n=2 Tax=Rhodoblastus sphagnicola TaxID=333368 RepID=A0A2S6ND38_9HYPH|nr:hypothetical protein CCR94_04825 [Rhodoblastus sphagnicola]
MATVVMVAFSVLANLLLKLDTLSSATAAKIFGFWGWRTLAGCASFGVALASYSLLLRLLPLNIAQSFAALQFVGIILASWLVLGEEITLLRAAGMATIIVGIIIVAASDA